VQAFDRSGLGAPASIAAIRAELESERLSMDLHTVPVSVRPTIMPCVFNGLHDVDWSSMHHAYGPADEVPALLLALRSADAAERDRALSRFYSAVHHQGDVYQCTTASLPFLLELAGDAAAPGRAAIVGLLVSIGSAAVGRCEGEWISPSGEPAGYAGAAAVLRERSEAFAGWASDADPGVRRAALPGLGLFLDDADRVTAVLRERLAAESGAGERLVVVEAMAALALRLPQLTDEVMAWLAGLAADPAAGPETRLAAVAQQARCAPERISEDVVPAAIGLLQEMALAAAADGAAWDLALLTAQKAPRKARPRRSRPPWMTWTGTGVFTL
jgi:hypothetical protein